MSVAPDQMAGSATGAEEARMLQAIDPYLRMLPADLRVEVEAMWTRLITEGSGAVQERSLLWRLTEADGEWGAVLRVVRLWLLDLWAFKAQAGPIERAEAGR